MTRLSVCVSFSLVIVRMNAIVIVIAFSVFVVVATQTVRESCLIDCWIDDRFERRNGGKKRQTLRCFEE